MDRFGNVNSAYSFDGVDDYIDYGYSPAFSPSNAITISAWIKRNLGGSACIVCRLDDYYTRAYYLAFWGDWLQMEVSEDGGIDNRLLNNWYPHPVTDTNWHHVAGVYGGSTITLYFDGVVAAGGEIWGDASSIDQNLSRLLIGFDLADNGSYFSGSIDEVRIYDRALSQSEIAELASSNPPTLAVTIDIKPGSYPNSINLGSAGVVPVAILSSSEFDARQVDPATVSLAGAKVKLIGKGDKFSCGAQDVDGDGLLDLVCHVVTAQFMIEPGDSVAVLEASTVDGQAIRGEDSIRIVP